MTCTSVPWRSWQTSFVLLAVTGFPAAEPTGPGTGQGGPFFLAPPLPHSLPPRHGRLCRSMTWRPLPRDRVRRLNWRRASVAGKGDHLRPRAERLAGGRRHRGRRPRSASSCTDRHLNRCLPLSGTPRTPPPSQSAIITQSDQVGSTVPASAFRNSRKEGCR